MTNIYTETIKFSFLVTYYQVIKSGHDMKNEKMKKKNSHNS